VLLGQLFLFVGLLLLVAASFVAFPHVRRARGFLPVGGDWHTDGQRIVMAVLLVAVAAFCWWTWRRLVPATLRKSWLWRHGQLQ
jgi:hypothetical protein